MQTLLNRLFDASRPAKRAISVIYDGLAVPLAIYFAMALRYGDLTPQIDKAVWGSIFITATFSILIFIKLGLYRAVVRFMAEKAFSNLALGIALSALVFGTSSFLTQASIPRSSILIYFFTAFTLIGFPRLFFRAIVNQLNMKKRESVIIYGAGDQGIALARALKNSDDYQAIAFIDDDFKTQGSHIHGLNVYPQNELPELLAHHQSRKVLLALDNDSSSKRRQLLEQLADFKAEVLTTPAVDDIVSGKARIEEIKDIAIEDLLGRDPVKPRQELMEQCITKLNVAVTGAGGSIGSELCRQVLKQKPNRLVLIELNEYHCIGLCLFA